MYNSKLVVFPRKCSKKLKQGDASKEDRKAVTQNLSQNILALPNTSKAPKARLITKEERTRNVFKIIRRARKAAKFAGLNEKRAKDKAAGKGKKPKKEEAGDD